MINIYLAARFSEKEKMKAIRQYLQAYDCNVTSHWLDEEFPPNTTLDQVPNDFKVKTAQQDLEDIKIADLVILFTVDPTIPTVRGGRHFESGYAVGKGKPLWVVGPRENIFHWLPEVRQFNFLEDCIRGLDTCLL